MSGCELLLALLLLTNSLAVTLDPCLVIPVANPKYAAEYLCKCSADPAAATYAWSRQDTPALPKGVKAENDRLHFFDLTSNLNGMYICNVTTGYRTVSAYVYREVQDSPLRGIITMGLWTFASSFFGL